MDLVRKIAEVAGRGKNSLGDSIPGPRSSACEVVDFEAEKISETALLARHLERLVKASGEGNNPHYNPYSLSMRRDFFEDDAALFLTLSKPTNATGWKRAVVLQPLSAGNIGTDAIFFGHAMLHGGRFLSELHRCELTLGIEESARGFGFGRLLLSAAIAKAERLEGLDWIELSVFEHNTIAIQLYEQAGFVRAGYLPDRFRLDGQSYGTLQMIRRVR